MKTRTGTEAGVMKSGAATPLELFDDSGRLIGVIARPVRPDVLGPGREKVYLSRPHGTARITSHAA